MQAKNHVVAGKRPRATDADHKPGCDGTNVLSNRHLLRVDIGKRYPGGVIKAGGVRMCSREECRM